MDALAVLVADISNGTLGDPLSKGLLLTSRLVGVPKPRGGLRPIAVGELFPKLAGLHVLDQIGGALPALLGPVQKGVGVAGGCERGVHVLQAALELGGDDVVLGKTDIANAFNTVPRGRMLADCYAHPELAPAFRQLDWSYNEPTRLLVVDHGVVRVVWSCEGTRQGDVLSQAAFAVSARRRYAAVLSAHPTVTAVAIHDDLTLAGPHADVVAALDTYQRETASDGHRLVPEKCSILWPHVTPTPAALTSACADRGFQIVTGCTEVYGAPVGLDRDAITRWVVDAAARDAQLFSDLEHHEMPMQVSVLLLRVSAVPTMDYTIRTVPSDLTRDAARSFDERVLRTFYAKTGIAVSDVAQQLLQLPIRNGGIGLRSIATACAPAYASSLALAAQDIAPLLAASHVDSTPPDLPTARGLSDALSFLRDEHVPAAEKTDAGQTSGDPAAFFVKFRDGCAPHFQQQLTRAIYDLHFHGILRAASLSDRARLLSTSSKRAGLWLTATPTSNELFIPDAAFLLALRLRLGLRPYDFMPSHCACGASLAADADANCSHTLTCQRQRARSGLLRHNGVLARLLAYCRRGNVLYQEAPMFDHRVPDAELFFSERTHHIDVSVTHPAADSYVTRAATTRGSAALRREGVKHAGHASNAAKAGALFTSAVVETYGAFGDALTGLTQTIVNHISEAAAGGDTAHQLLCALRQELSVAVQKGNARVIQQTIAAARHASASTGGGHVPHSRHLRDAANAARARAFVRSYDVDDGDGAAGGDAAPLCPDVDYVVVPSDDDNDADGVTALADARSSDGDARLDAADGDADDATADASGVARVEATRGTAASGHRRLSVFARLSRDPRGHGAAATDDDDGDRVSVADDCGSADGHGDADEGANGVFDGDSSYDPAGER
ncbi:MAG TPA: hypothetical protein VEC57_15570 [Candidatus Limnocylindrales bacterium]|nr:hypothetical protein [Candidatus Limnocylindrales bacterium]